MKPSVNIPEIKNNTQFVKEKIKYDENKIYKSLFEITHNDTGEEITINN